MMRLPLILALALLQSTFAQVCQAQFVSAIGTSGFSKETYSCRTYSGGEDIIIVKKGKQRIVSKKAGKANVERSLTKISRKLVDAKRTLKERSARAGKLLKSASIALPKVAEEFRQLRDVLIPKSEQLVALYSGQKSELDFIRTGIDNCGKAPKIIENGNSLFIGGQTAPVSGDQWYIIAARHVFTYTGQIPAKVCVDLDGSKTLTTWSQNVCCTAYDGSGSSNPFDVCASTGLRPDQGLIGLGGRCDKFSRNYYNDHLAEVQSGLQRSVKVYLPSAGGC